MWLFSVIFLYIGYSTLSDTINNPKFGTPDALMWSIFWVLTCIALIVMGVAAGIFEWRSRRPSEVKTVYVDRPDPVEPEDDDDWGEFILLTRLISFQIPDGGEFEVEFRKASDQAIAACIKEFGEDSLYDYPIVSIKISLHPTMRLWAFLEVEYYTHPGEWMEEA